MKNSVNTAQNDTMSLTKYKNLGDVTNCCSEVWRGIWLNRTGSSIGFLGQSRNTRGTEIQNYRTSRGNMVVKDTGADDLVSKWGGLVWRKRWMGTRENKRVVQMIVNFHCHSYSSEFQIFDILTAKYPVTTLIHKKNKMTDCRKSSRCADKRNLSYAKNRITIVIASVWTHEPIHTASNLKWYDFLNGHFYKTMHHQLQQESDDLSDRPSVVNHRL